MTERPNPVFRSMEDVLLVGTMAIYDSQAEVSERVPSQWREFRLSHPALSEEFAFFGASPCTGDGKIHYLTGVRREGVNEAVSGELLTLEGGEYAVFRVDDPALLRDTWVWVLGSWLPASGRRERNAPEFERFAGIGEDGLPVGPVEIWVPLEPGARA